MEKTKEKNKSRKYIIISVVLLAVLIIFLVANIIANKPINQQRAEANVYQQEDVPFSGNTSEGNASDPLSIAAAAGTSMGVMMTIFVIALIIIAVIFTAQILGGVRELGV